MQKQITPDELDKLIERELCRRSFWLFCLYYDFEFFSKRPFLEKVANAFQQIYDKVIKRLSISMPPRAGKSYITSLFCAWLLGKDSSGSVMRNCCTATLYDKFSYDTRAIMRSDKYREIFPAVILSDDKQSLKGWNTIDATQVSYFGGGVGGTIIGFGASLVAITDDLIRSFEDAVSDKMLTKTHSWYDGTHSSRQEKNCPVIDIGTRWSKKDTIGRQSEEGFYDLSIVISALDEKQESFCEDVKSTEEYIDIRARTSKEIWEAEYMQNPIEASGTLFTKADLKRFKMSDLKLSHIVNGVEENLYDAAYGYIDVADEGDDRLCFLTGLLFGKNIYITDVIFSADNIDITAPQCAAEIKRIRHDYVRIESNNQGGGFKRVLQNLIPEVEGKLLTVKNVTNKHTRILVQYGMIKHNFYFRNDYHKNSPYDLFMQEVFDYQKGGSSKHDDAPDTAAGLAKMFISFLKHVWE